MSTKKQEKEVPNHDLEILAAFKAVANSDEGVKVLRYIMTQCGFKISSTVGNAHTGEILPYNTIHNEARRGIWIDLRLNIPKTRLNIIEMER